MAAKRNKQTADIGAGKAGPGRPKGSVNKVTGSIKAALLDAFEKRGGVPALVEWANENPTEFYKLVGRLVPTEVTGADGGPVEIAVQTWTFGGKRVTF